MPTEKALIGVHAQKKPRIRIHKRLKDSQGNEIRVVRSMIDGVIAWGGPLGGKARADVVSLDPTIGAEHKSLVVGIALIPPGNELALHSHEVEEVYTIIKGKGIMYTDTGEESEVSWGDCIWNGPGVRHCLRNHQNEDLWLVWCWGAAKVPSAIEELEMGAKLAKEKKGEYAEQFDFRLIGPP